MEEKKTNKANETANMSKSKAKREARKKQIEEENAGNELLKLVVLRQWQSLC